MTKIPVIIDCDPGHDDALMLMLAFGSGMFDVRAITVSAGNQTQEKTLTNTLKILTLLDVNVPVYRGADKPLVRELSISDEVVGTKTLDNLLPAKYLFEPQPISATEGIAKALADSDIKLTIVATGPLTNIAVFLQTYPGLKSQIERISLMGGGIFQGNMTPLAEFNIYADPEAAAIVFRSGLPITMCGLDVTHKALVFQRDIELFRSLPNTSGKIAAELMEHISVFYKENHNELDGGSPLHDPCPIAWLMNPGIFKTKACYVDVETKGELTSGVTVVDFYDILKKQPNVLVAYDIDRDALLNMLFNAVRNLP